MTRFQERKIECGNCGSPVDVVMYESVNVTVNPRLMGKIKRREINNLKCPTCGQKSELEQRFLFVDMEQQLWVWCYPEQMEGDRAEIMKDITNNAVNEMLLRFTGQSPLLVFGYDELLEKINHVES